MLTGRPPFTHDALGELVVAHMTLPAIDPREVNPSIPAPLAELTNELLRKDPATRPPSMRAIAERCATFVARMTTVPGTPTQMPAEVPAAAPAAKTTFGTTASELVPDDEDVALPRRRAPLLVGAAAAVFLVGAGSFAFTRLRGAGEGGAAPTAGSATTTEPNPRPEPAVGATTLPPTTATTAAAAAAAAGGSAAAPPHGKEASGKGAARAPSEGDGTETTASDRAAADKESRASAKRGGGARHTSTSTTTVAAVTGGAASAGAATSPSPAAAAVPLPELLPPAEKSDKPDKTAELPPELTGTWEGPSVDQAKRQNGRLYLTVAADGKAMGWMFNTTVNQSFRMAGRLAGRGSLHLTCQCAESQRFTVEGALRGGGGPGQLEGDLVLASKGGGVFGRSHLVMRRNAGPRP